MEQVFVTTDYSVFKRLNENRKVKEPHVQELIRKVKIHGLTDTVIFVNEKMEVLDGQHRLEVLKRLGLPVKYKICQNMGIKEVILMNSSQQSWTIDDYITSHCQQGIVDYIKFSELYSKFPELGTNVFLSVLGSYVAGRPGLQKVQIALREGRLPYPFAQEDQFLSELEYLSKFAFVRKYKSHGRRDTFYKAISACYHCENIDNDKLLDRMSELVERMASFNTFRECLQSIEDIYNLRARKHTYLTTEVLQWLEAKKSETDAEKEEVLKDEKK